MLDQRREVPVRLLRAAALRSEEQALVRVDDALLRVMYVRMIRVRAFELRVARLLEEGVLKGVQLSAGQEAVAVGACSALRDEDYLVSTDRPHGHLLAKGVSPRALLAELLTKADGLASGKGGPTFLFDAERGVLGTFGGGDGLPIAVGAAFSARSRQRDLVVLAFLNDEAVGSGAFAEAANLAALRALPVVFVYENLLTEPDAYRAVRALDSLIALAPGWGMAGVAVDGADPLAVFRAVGEAAALARAGRGPSFIEARLDPPRAVLAGDGGADDVVRRRDPIVRFAERLRMMGLLTAEDEALVERRAREEADADLAWARSWPAPDPGTLLRDVYQAPIDRAWPRLGVNDG
ncbi:MAG: thiamine pyrophosphate-dependent enzyme [Chloroflexota bacterium]|nr:thiamine pyrophosphate-dependent enzyme [Dehalococcoidia bacterium]MDW8254448.1 thiamine pyrophosphate-dependent enzyme [Chloroflexota bacterium]